MRDHRDQLVDQISKLINISAIERDNGTVTLYIGGRTIVDDTKFNPIKTSKVSINGMVVSDLRWADDEAKVNVNNGEIAGLIEIRDNVITDLSNKTDRIAKTLINSVNEIHKTGYGLDGSNGLDFFSGTNARNIKVNDDHTTGILGHPERVASSANGEVGNNEIALKIASLSEIKVTSTGLEVPDNVNNPDAINISKYYSEIINSLGTNTQHASMMLESTQMLATSYEEYRESVSGVSLDEETAELIRLQRAYEASVKYLSVVDEMLETLMSIGR